MKFYSFIILFALSSLACGVQAELPTETPARLHEVSSPRPIASPTVTEQPTASISMMVCHSGGLNVRIAPGLSNQVIGTPLPDGYEIIIIGQPVRTLDGALWQQIESGWVNARYLCE